MKKNNLIVILAIIIVIIAFLLGFSVANSKNELTKNISTNTKDKIISERRRA